MSSMQEITAFSPQAWNSPIQHIGQLAGITPPKKGWLCVWVSLSHYHPYQGNRVWKDWVCMDLKPQVKFLYIHESLYLLEWFHESRDYRWWTDQVHQWFLNSGCWTGCWTTIIGKSWYEMTPWWEGNKKYGDQTGVSLLFVWWLQRWLAMNFIAIKSKLNNNFFTYTWFNFEPLSHYLHLFYW